MRLLTISLFIFLNIYLIESTNRTESDVPVSNSEKSEIVADEKSDKTDDLYEDYEYVDEGSSENAITSRREKAQENATVSDGFPNEVFLTLRNITADAATAFRSFTNRNDVADLQASASDNLNVTSNDTYGDSLEAAGINLRALRDAGHPPEIVEESPAGVYLPYKHAKIDTADLSDCALQGEWKPMGVAHSHLHVAGDNAHQADILQSVGSYSVPKKVIPHWGQNLVAGAHQSLQELHGAHNHKPAFGAGSGGFGGGLNGHGGSGAFLNHHGADIGALGGGGVSGPFHKGKGSKLAPPPLPPIIFGKKPGYWKSYKSKHKFHHDKRKRPPGIGHGGAGGFGFVSHGSGGAGGLAGHLGGGGGGGGHGSSALLGHGGGGGHGSSALLGHGGGSFSGGHIKTGPITGGFGYGGGHLSSGGFGHASGGTPIPLSHNSGGGSISLGHSSGGSSIALGHSSGGTPIPLNHGSGGSTISLGALSHGSGGGHISGGLDHGSHISSGGFGGAQISSGGLGGAQISLGGHGHGSGGGQLSLGGHTHGSGGGQISLGGHNHGGGQLSGGFGAVHIPLGGIGHGSGGAQTSGGHGSGGLGHSAHLTLSSGGPEHGYLPLSDVGHDSASGVSISEASGHISGGDASGHLNGHLNAGFGDGKIVHTIQATQGFGGGGAANIIQTGHIGQEVLAHLTDDSASHHAGDNSHSDASYHSSGSSLPDSTFSSSHINQGIRAGNSLPDAAYLSSHQNFAVHGHGISDDSSSSSTFTCGKNHDHNTNYHTATFQVADHDHPSSVDVLRYEGDAAVLIQSGDVPFHDQVLPERKHYKTWGDKNDAEASGSDNRNELVSQAAQLTSEPAEQEAGQSEVEQAQAADDGEEPERHSYYHEITKVTKIPATSVGSVEYSYSQYETKPQSFSQESGTEQEEPNAEQPQIIKELEELSNKFQMNLENPQQLFDEPPSQELAYHFPFHEGGQQEGEKHFDPPLQDYKIKDEVVTEYPHYIIPNTYTSGKPVELSLPGKKPQIQYITRPRQPHFNVNYLQPKQPFVVLRKHKPKQYLSKKQNYEVIEHSGERHRPLGDIFPPQKFPKQFHSPKPNFAVDRPKNGWRPPTKEDFYHYDFSQGKKIKKYKSHKKVLAPVLVRRPVTVTPVIRVLKVSG